MVKEYIHTIPKAQSIKEITDKLDLIKIKNFCFVKVSKLEDLLQIGKKKKVFQKKHLIKNCHPKYTKKSKLTCKKITY